MRTTKQRIEQIEASPVVGDAHHDQSLMYAIDKLVMDSEVPMGYKVRALAKLDKVMGETGHPVTKDDVVQYVTCMSFSG